MSYNFNPLNDEELDAINLVPKGNYDFTVVKSTRKTSKNGNPMAELQLTIWDDKGKEHCIFDYLVFSNISLNIKKINHFCKAVGLIEEYKKGAIPEDLEGCSGKVEIGVQDEQPKSTGGFYPKKNIVVDYIYGNIEIKSKVSNTEDFIDDAIPF